MMKKLNLLLLLLGLMVTHHMQSAQRQPTFDRSIFDSMDSLVAFLNQDPNNIRAELGSFHDSLLQYAVSHRQTTPAMVELLFMRGAPTSVSESDKFGLWFKLAQRQTVVDDTMRAIAKLLIDNRQDINELAYGRVTALMYAAQYGNFEVVDFLISHGALVDVQNKFGDTAINYSRGEMRQLLEKALKAQQQARKAEAPKKCLAQ